MIIWILFPKEKISEIELKSNSKKCSVKQIMSDYFNINLNFRLRNSKGNIICMNSSIESNTKSKPYILEPFEPSSEMKESHQVFIYTS